MLQCGAKTRLNAALPVIARAMTASRCSSSRGESLPDLPVRAALA
jgi:hypothetical protein